MSLDPGFTTIPSRRIFSAGNRLRCMLDVEAALARATADTGLIPSPAGEAIADRCRRDSFDADAIFARGWRDGSPVISLVTALRNQVGEPHAPFVHHGATTQDIVDTGTVLQIREGLDVLEHDLRALGRGLAALAAQHRATPRIARTLLRAAGVTTFGLTVAQWLDPLTRDLRRIGRLRAGLALQLGGAVGDRAAWGRLGPEVAAKMGQRLGLEVPTLPWHSARDRIGEIASAVALHGQTLAKIAHDLILLCQDEVAEVSLRGGASSSMPGKRNPIDAVRAAAASRFAIGQAAILLSANPNEHQRAAGTWQLEWAVVPTMFHSTLAGTEALGHAFASLEVHEQRMADHLALLPTPRPVPAPELDALIDGALEAWHEADS